METITIKQYKAKLGYKPTDDINEIQEIECLWDYPTSEKNYCIENNIKVVPVQLENEIRLFELN